MLNKLNCMQPNVSLDLSKINPTVKKSYKQKFKRRLFRLNKSKTSNLVSSTFVSNNQSIPKYSDQFSDYSDDDSESDISFNSLIDEDLNSSVSSVSSFEYEPFEEQPKQSQSLKKSFVRKPLLSSSRTSLVKKSPKMLTFHPHITSSRKSLFNQAKKPVCSQCNNDSVPGASGYFSFAEEQICSSTHVSIDFKAKNKSESIFTNSSIFSLSKSNSDFF